MKTNKILIAIIAIITTISLTACGAKDNTPEVHTVNINSVIEDIDDTSSITSSKTTSSENSSSSSSSSENTSSATSSKNNSSNNSSNTSSTNTSSKNTSSVNNSSTNTSSKNNSSTNTSSKNNSSKNNSSANTSSTNTSRPADTSSNNTTTEIPVEHHDTESRIESKPESKQENSSKTEPVESKHSHNWVKKTETVVTKEAYDETVWVDTDVYDEPEIIKSHYAELVFEKCAICGEEVLYMIFDPDQAWNDTSRTFGPETGTATFHTVITQISRPGNDPYGAWETVKTNIEEDVTREKYTCTFHTSGDYWDWDIGHQESCWADGEPHTTIETHMDVYWDEAGDLFDGLAINYKAIATF